MHNAVINWWSLVTAANYWIGHVVAINPLSEKLAHDLKMVNSVP